MLQRNLEILATRPQRGRSAILFLAVGFVTFVSAAGRASEPRVVPEGELPKDSRLAPPKDLNGDFPFNAPSSRAEWEQRAAAVRRRVLVATGLWPMPERTPLNAVIHGRAERDGFTVEKVFFESYPQHFVTGLLFRPRDVTGRRPAVLCPHGHGGRLQDYGENEIRKLIVQGAERFEDSGRFPKLALCAQLARMGCVAFIYDMLGYADSGQISFELAHRFAKQRPEFESKASWGLFSTQAELRMQSVFGLQTWNSIRALDFLCGLPDVDPARVGVTGGSGGGTQTIVLCGIDSRPAVAFPQGMVSTSMQGGCTCENCCLLRIGTGNVELAGIFAPKPQGMTAANDWTKEMMTAGFPQLQQLYELYGKKADVLCKPLLHFPHNYNYVTRAVMYAWMNKHLRLGLPEPVVEEDFRQLTPDEWTVWDDQHPRPDGGDGYERELTKSLDEQSRRQLSALSFSEQTGASSFREVVGGAFDVILGRVVPAAAEIQREKVGKINRGSYLEFKDLLYETRFGEVVPTISVFPTATPWNRQVVIWIDGEGKTGLFANYPVLRPEIQRLLDSGFSVVTADLFFQGDFTTGAAAGAATSENRTVSNPREYAGFTFGYNHPLFAQRTHDILMLVSFVCHDEHQPEQVHLVGVNGAGPLVAAARAQAGVLIAKAAIDTDGFRFENLASYRDANFLPGAVKYGDLPALLALNAPEKLWLAGENGAIPAIVSEAYKTAGQIQNVTSTAVKNHEIAASAVQWLESR